MRKALNYAEATKETRRLQSNKLFVSGFESTTTEQDIESVFSTLGEVDRVLYSLNSLNESFRGFCYVIMKNQDDYQKLINMGQFNFEGREISI